jgi:hypothetical protein
MVIQCRFRELSQDSSDPRDRRVFKAVERDCLASRKSGEFSMEKMITTRAMRSAAMEAISIGMVFWLICYYYRKITPVV